MRYGKRSPRQRPRDTDGIEGPKSTVLTCQGSHCRGLPAEDHAAARRHADDKLPSTIQRRFNAVIKSTVGIFRAYRRGIVDR